MFQVIKSTVLAMTFSAVFIACKTSDVGSPDGSALKDSSTAETESPNQCWKHTYGRGVGTIPNACPDGDKNGALCYPECKPGFKGVGPVCWEKCPEGYTDDGAFCRRPSPLDINAKKSYGRTAGTLMQCADGKVKDAGLCYDECKTGYKGIGPVCWGECPAELPFSCAAGCTATEAACAGNVLESAKSVLDVVTAAASKDSAGTASALGDVVKSFNFPICSEPAVIP